MRAAFSRWKQLFYLPGECENMQLEVISAFRRLNRRSAGYIGGQKIISALSGLYRRSKIYIGARRKSSQDQPTDTNYNKSKEAPETRPVLLYFCEGEKRCFSSKVVCFPAFRPRKESM